MALSPDGKLPVVMTAKILEAQYPLLHAEVCSEAVAEASKGMDAKIDAAHKVSYSKGLAEGAVKGAKTEKERIQSVLGKTYPGFEAIVNARAFDGKSTGPETAEAVLEAMKEKNAKGLMALIADAPDPIEPELDEESEDIADANADPLKAAWEKGKLSAKLKKEFGGDYDSYKAYYENQDEQYKKTKQVTLS